jgi:hypothetical protein
VQSATGSLKYDPSADQFTFPWKVGGETGSVTLSVQVSYTATATMTTLSESATVAS